MWSGDTIFEQHRRLVNYSKIRAEVIESKVAGSGDQSYRPAITLRYEWQEGLYRSNRYSTSHVSMSQSEAQRIADDYRPGMVVFVYFDPTNPSDAALRKDYLLNPYLLSLSGVAMLALAFWGMRWRWAVKRAKGPVTLRRSLMLVGMAATVLWESGAALVLGHYFLHQPAPFPLSAWVAAAIAGLGGLIPLGYAVSATVRKKL